MSTYGMYSDVQIARLVQGRGMTDENGITMTAIALAESQGNADAVGDLALQDGTWGPSVGLWQIRTLKNPGKNVDRDIRYVVAPGNNAAAMETISKDGTDPRPWTTYKTGAYLLYMPRAKAAWAEAKAMGPVQGGVDMDPGEAIGENLPGEGAVTSLIGKANKIADLFGSGAFWIRVTKVGGGLGLVIVGLVVLNRDLIAPLGRVGKIAAGIAPGNSASTPERPWAKIPVDAD